MVGVCCVAELPLVGLQSVGLQISDGGVVATGVCCQWPQSRVIRLGIIGR